MTSQTPPPTGEPSQSPYSPSYIGSASQAASGGFSTSCVREVVEPWIARDMERQQLADVRALIGMLLSPNRTGPKNACIERFEDYRTIINSMWEKKLRNKKPPIIGNLEKYCNGPEVERYPHLVLGLNESLKMLKSVQYGRSPSTLEILFVCNHPVEPFGDHGQPSVRSERMPDVLITSLRAARLLAQGSATWHSLAFDEVFRIKPDLCFKWYSVLSAVELKRLRDVLASTLDFRTPVETPVFAPHVISMKPHPKKRSRSAFSAAQPPAKRIKSEAASSVAPRCSPRSTPNSTMRQTSTIVCPGGTSTSPMPEPQEVKTSIPPIVQCGLYAAEMLCGSLGVFHSINLFIVDDVAWVVYTDRQGVIQSEGINFLKDFPSFLVLLYALQRLKLEEWGLNPSLDDRVFQMHEGAVYSDNDGIYQKASWSAALGGKVFDIYGQNTLYSALTMVGRGTVTVECRSSDKPDTRFAMKIYWPEKPRRNESEIISDARKAGGEDSSITEHLPVVIQSTDSSYPTDHVRTVLGLEAGKGRVLRVIIFAWLEPITTLSGHHFVRAWLECILCHYKLWKLGFEHGDPSISNLMIDSTGRGVLNDWDLSHRAGEPHCGGERTGTATFMALELLCCEYRDGRMERQYHHDLEGFIWILPWVFLQFQDSVRINRQLADWEIGDFEKCHQQKSSLLGGGMTSSMYPPTKSWRSEWKGFAVHLLVWLVEGNIQRYLQQQTAALAPADVFKKFYEKLHRLSQSTYPAFHDIIREMGVAPPPSSVTPMPST